MNKMLAATVMAAQVLSAGTVLAQTQRRERGPVVTESIPDIPQRIIERMRQYQNTRSAAFQDWDPAGAGMLIATRFGETSQIHHVAEPAGARRQITFFDEPVGAAKMCPNLSQRAFLFTKDVGGGEFYQIYHFDLERGGWRMLTDGTSRNGGIGWADDGSKFAYFSTQRNGRDWDIYVASAQAPAQGRRVLASGGSWVPMHWAPDHNRLIVMRYVSANESYYHVLDARTAEVTQINPQENKIAYGAAVWSRDGRGIYLASDEESEFKGLKYYDLTTKAFEDLSREIPWDVRDVAVSPQGDLLAFAANVNGVSKLYLMDVLTRQYKTVADIPIGQVRGLKFHSDGKRLAFTLNTPQTPSDAFVLNTDSKALTRWTFSEVGGLNSADFVVPELTEYETFDRSGGQARRIPAFVFKPGHTPGPHPVLIYIHGGPEGQYAPAFSSTFQYWINELGIAVIAPNVRGSSGYGKSYLKLDNAYQREDSVKDIGALLDWISRQPDLDAQRVAVYGGSYGGYMTLAAMAHYNSRLKCGVDVVGISNFVTFLENTKEYRRDLRRAEYGDERDPQMRAFLQQISPTTNAHKINKPMFIAQGLNDPRVPVGESEQIVAAIRKNGGTVWYMLAKDEGHGFRKKTNRDYFNHATVLFLERHLLN